MAQISDNKKRRFSRRTTTFFWSVIVATLTIILLAYERIDILYVLATLALVVLLAIVAKANLEGKNEPGG